MPFSQALYTTEGKWNCPHIEMGESVTGNRSVPIHSVLTVCTHPSQKAKKTLNDADIKAERVLRQSMEKISRAFVCICRLQSLKNATRIYFIRV